MNATLAIALLGVVLSVASLVWQFASYILTGPRISVELQLGVTNDDDSSTMSWSLPNSGPMTVDERSRDATREVAIVVARNRLLAPLGCLGGAAVAHDRASWGASRLCAVRSRRQHPCGVCEQKDPQVAALAASIGCAPRHIPCKEALTAVGIQTVAFARHPVSQAIDRGTYEGIVTWKVRRRWLQRSLIFHLSC